MTRIGLQRMNGDIRGVIRSRKSDRQINCQNKKDQQRST